MSGTKTFSLLQAVAAIASLAILLWSLGLPSIRYAEAANVTSFSDTLSDSAPNASSSHTIVFTTPSGLAAGEEIVLTFDNNFTFDGNLGAEDIDLASTSDYSVQNGAAAGETWGVATTSNTITLTSGTAVLTANATVTIEIGLIATFGTNGDSEILNPGTGSYTINVDLASPVVDSGETRVAIVDTVTVTASVDTTFQFTVRGLPTGSTVNGTTTTGTTTPTTIPFGQLEPGVASTAGQALDVITNAANGFVVTVQTDSQLLSSTGADIDTFSNGTYTPSPANWTPPTGSIGNENTYGHWGVATEDNSTSPSLIDEYADNQYTSVGTSTPTEVFRHDGPADGSTAHQGTTEVAYTVAITALQEAGDDYTATLTYVATPVF